MIGTHGKAGALPVDFAKAKGHNEIIGILKGKGSRDPDDKMVNAITTVEEPKRRNTEQGGGRRVTN